MCAAVKGRQDARIAETEDRILRAATRLFVRRGYQGTTLADVAEAAGVGHRTVYVRFGTKPDLLKRAIDVALVGDTAPVDMAHRDWFRTALTAATLPQRLTALADGTADLMRRTGDLFAVAMQAEANEPVIAAAFGAGRRASRKNVRDFVEGAAADGLLHQGADVEWLAETAALLVHAESYVLLRRTRRWRNEDYRDWLLLSLQKMFTVA